MTIQAANDFIGRTDQDHVIRKLARERFGDIVNVGSEHGYDFSRDEFDCAMRERKATGDKPGDEPGDSCVSTCQCEQSEEPGGRCVQTCQCVEGDEPNTCQCVKDGEPSQTCQCVPDEPSQTCQCVSNQ
jgi:hypothetical protein